MGDQVVFRFKLDIAGEVQMDRGISRFADGLADYAPLWPIIEGDFYSLEERQFATTGAEGGDAWQDLSAAYEAWKTVHYPGKPILERSGALVRSLTDPNDPQTVRIEERKTLTLGTRVPYAIYHQSIAPRKRLPRRPEIMLTEAFKRTVMHHVQVYLVEMASKLGFRTGGSPGNAWRYSSEAGSAEAWRRAMGVGV
jgi:phage gpG-like protein